MAGGFRGVGAAVVLLCAGGIGLAPGASAQLRGEEVRQLRFEGNETFPADSLERAIVTRETDCRSGFLVLFCALGMDFSLRRSTLRASEVPRDRTRLTIWYQRRGFLDVQVDEPVIERGSGEVEVLFRITEGRPWLAAEISFRGADDFAEEGLLDDLPLREGDRLSVLTRDATQDTLVQRLKERGFAHADVFQNTLRPADDPYNARVTFEVEPGPLATYGAIDIEGIEELTPGTVRRTLQFASGDVYRDSDIDEARARLFGLDIVQSARVEPDLEVRDSIVPVEVRIQEGDAYRVRAGVGWNTAECLNLEARWTSRNFMGGGRLLQVRGRTGNIFARRAGNELCPDTGDAEYADLTWVTAVEFAQPWIFSTENTFSASVFAERQTLSDIFIRRAVGFQAALTRRFDPRTPLTLFYRPELSELDADDVLFCIGFLVCTLEDLSLLEGANRLAPVGVNLTRDRSDDLLNPRSGYRLTLDVEHAAQWTGSNFRYDRAVAEATGYSRVSGGIVLAARLRTGWVGSGAFDALVNRGTDVSIVHPQRRFFAGGANSVRGYPQSRLGPRVFVVEDPVQLLAPFPEGPACSPDALMDLSCDAGVGGSGVVFKELPTGGTRVIEANAELRFPLGAWLEGVAFSDLGQAWGTGETVDLGELVLTPGVGLRFPSPVGPIRIDLAYRPPRERLLSLLTPQIRPYSESDDDPEDRLVIGDPIPFVQTENLALLGPRLPGLEAGGRFQLHVSIGQAF